MSRELQFFIARRSSKHCAHAGVNPAVLVLLHTSTQPFTLMIGKLCCAA
jgi:hypothetical protein